MKPIVFFLVFFIGMSTILTNRKGSLAPEPEILPSSITRNVKYPETLAGLKSEITKLISAQEGTYSVQFDDFSSTDSLSINEEDVYTAASVIKIPILAATYQLSDQGIIDLDTKIYIDESEVQDWGTGSIRYESQPIVHTVRELTRLLIEKSDNTAAYVLNHSVIGAETLQEIIDSWGLTQTNIAENETSNQDISRLMRMIFEGKIAGKALTDEMIGWMDDSDFENRLPALLPETVDVYHKIGNEIQIIHDVGVISMDGDNYYIGVLTSGITDIEQTESAIAQISDLVYNYKLHKTKE